MKIPLTVAFVTFSLGWLIGITTDIDVVPYTNAGLAWITVALIVRDNEK